MRTRYPLRVRSRVVVPALLGWLCSCGDDARGDASPESTGTTGAGTESGPSPMSGDPGTTTGDPASTSSGSSDGADDTSDGGVVCPDQMDCSAVECGPDPVCDVSCGECDADHACVSGRCNVSFWPDISEPHTLSIALESVSPSGDVVLNGIDTGEVAAPFDVDWGDGMATSGYFPLSHAYASTAQNYAITLTSHYAGGGTDTARALARFVAPVIAPVPVTDSLRVTIPAAPVVLGTHAYPPPSLDAFDDGQLGIVPRADVEYVLSIAAMLQYELTNQDVYMFDGAFRQLVLEDPAFGGMYALWFTDPAAFGAASTTFTGAYPYSSFFHEMGHNFSLNTPADYYYGGKIDGNANAIFSEATAQIYQHATAYELLNSTADWGLEDDLLLEIELSARASIRGTKVALDRYVAGGSVFETWNDSFLVLAHRFFEHAEVLGTGYGPPLSRMVAMLQTFDATRHASWDQNNDTPEAETFRATWMVAAMSYGFAMDLRPDFQRLGFPIDDALFDEIYGQLPP
jgi:hypothetical protein